MPRFDPIQAAKDWQQKLAGSADKYKRKVKAVREHPGVAAARHKDAMRTRVNQAIDDGTWERNVQAGTLQQWQDVTANVGSQNLGTGAQKGLSKMEKFLSAAAPLYDAIVDEVRSMPNATESDRRARMNRNFDLMKQLKGVGKSR